MVTPHRPPPGVRQADPTPAEIAAMTAEIRAGWDEETFWRRAGYPDGPPPVEIRRVAAGQHSVREPAARRVPIGADV